MWTYILRRCLSMLPTLFGVTIISFVIMQLAPGDPLIIQMGPSGATGTTSQTREAYLIQKRDLRLDRPLLLNFRDFRNYEPAVRSAAFYMGRGTPEIAADLEQLAKVTLTPEQAQRLAFLQSLKIPDFSQRLHGATDYRSLAEAVRLIAPIFAEDIGQYGVRAAMAVLQDPAADRRDRIGAIRALNSMVIDPFIYTYSRTPSPDETPAVKATWQLWWERNEAKLPAVSPQRAQVLEQKLKELAREPSRRVVLSAIERFDRRDLRFFAEHLFGDSTLPEKAIDAQTLRLFVGRPLALDVPLDATDEQITQATANWQVHYKLHHDRYEAAWPARIYHVFGDTQYAHMVWRLITFKFGRSALRTREPVSEKIWETIKVSAPIMLLSQMLIYLVAVPLGVFCAVNRGNVFDRGTTLALFLLYSIPPFIAGMLFLLYLCSGQYLKLFPPLGLHSDGYENLSRWKQLLDYLWHVTLPIVCLSLFGLAGLAMYGRASMLNVLQQDYIRTARAKGVAEVWVILKHALRNGLIPIVTLFANFLPAMLGGSVLIEYLFNIPGMGRLSQISIEQKDIPTLMALIYIDAIVVMVSILITDLLYIVVDPRISFTGRGGD